MKKPVDRIVFLIKASSEGGFEVRARGYSIFTQADYLDRMETMIRDAIFW